jgi:shikimate dehydrogenase
MKKVCVIGYPAKHSLSPAIHNYWLEKYGIEGKYEIREIEPDKFDGFFQNLEKEGYVGCNVTIPYKERAFELVREMGGEIGEHPSHRGHEYVVGAINTIAVKDSKYIGKNTDWLGFLHNIQHSVPNDIFVKCFTAGKAVVLGAGGAARGIILALGASGMLGTPDIILLNRTRDKAERIKNELADELRYDFNINVIDWERRNDALHDANLLVNTTSLGMTGQPPLDIDLSNLPKDALVTDIVYRPLITPLLQAAKERGNPIVDGLGMLLYQAVPGFEMWFADELAGRRVEVPPELRLRVEALL